jgi:calcineurin-like phosphoesterase family protein
MAEIFYSSDHHLFHDNIWKLFKIRCDCCSATGWAIDDDGEAKECPACSGTGEISARPFSSTKEMHEFMLDLHNQTVKPQDHWWCLGDISLLRASVDKHKLVAEVKKYQGHRRLILGNHDHYDVRVYREMFEKVRGYNRVGNLILSHVPIDSRSIPRGCVNVHGHIHTNPSPPGPYINVSVEAINYRPLSLHELTKMAEEKLRTR